jgi:hypothetical protein
LNEHTITECLLFPDIFDRPVVAKFDQRQGSSDGGAILLQAAERRLGLTSALAACLRDDRQTGKVQHELRELITQRVMAIALGYEDANDAARLACDPIHKLLVGRDPVASKDLASRPTLSRFENAPDRKELLRMTEALACGDVCRLVFKKEQKIVSHLALAVVCRRLFYVPLQNSVLALEKGGSKSGRAVSKWHTVAVLVYFNS